MGVSISRLPFSDELCVSSLVSTHPFLFLLLTGNNLFPICCIVALRRHSWPQELRRRAEERAAMSGATHDRGVIKLLGIFAATALADDGTGKPRDDQGVLFE